VSVRVPAAALSKEIVGGAGGEGWGLTTKKGVVRCF